MTIGVNWSGSEYGDPRATDANELNGWSHIFPDAAALKFLSDNGCKLLRLPFRWERTQKVLLGPLDSTEVAAIGRVLDAAKLLGMKVILDAHNYGRYDNVVIGDGPVAVGSFGDFWRRIVIAYNGHGALYGYDLMNEPHDMGLPTRWPLAAQTAVNAIRTIDTATPIIVSGDGWSGAHSWSTINAGLNIIDPSNKIIYQAHQYFDPDRSGTYTNVYDPATAYPAMGGDLIKPFTDWLKAKGFRGIIGEFGAPVTKDARWGAVLDSALVAMKAANVDGTAWAGGPWWPADYAMRIGHSLDTKTPYFDKLASYFNQVAAPVIASATTVNVGAMIDTAITAVDSLASRAQLRAMLVSARKMFP